MKTGISILLVLAMNIAMAQVKQYVCEPCGRDCDKTVYNKEGTCPHCGMVLVENASVKFKDLSFEQFCERLRANPKAILLDVRSPAEFNGTATEVPTFGHFKNAMNVNVTELESKLSELSKYKDREILVYCSHSHRSPRASYFLTTHDFSNVKNMSGGVSTLTADMKNECLDKFYVRHLR